MSLTTYRKEDQLIGRPWPPLHRIDDDNDVLVYDSRSLRPGDWVCFADGPGEGRGMVVAASPEEVAVLWSREPRRRFDSASFQRMAVPVAKVVA